MLKSFISVDINLLHPLDESKSISLIVENVGM